MMLILFLSGYVLVVAATSCSDLEFQCGSGTCIDITDQCDGFPDCPDYPDEVVGCGVQCELNDLKKFLYKDEQVKEVYRSGDTIRISCPVDDDYGIAYEYEYTLEEKSTELTCNNGRWVRYIPKCIGNADSSIKSTPRADLDAVTNTSEVDVTQYGSTSNARSESGNSRDDDIKPQPDFGFITTTEELYADKADCQLHGFSQYHIENVPTEKSYRHGQRISIACPQGDADDHNNHNHQLSGDSSSELTCHDGQWIGYYPECFKSCLHNVLKEFLVEDQDTMEEYRSGEIITVSCSGNSLESQGEKNHQSYEYDDQARNLICQNGRWIGEYPECFERCRRSRIQGTLVVETESEYFLPGDVVQIQICWGNFPVEGDGQLTCMANGVWYGNATCPPLSDSDCLSPPDVQNAYILSRLWDRYPEGSIVTYKCGNDFWLRGNNKLTCINGKWTEEQFYCITQTCFYPGEIENGQILNITVEAGQYFHFSCDDGYILKGPHAILCNADGKFYSETMPTCEVVQCQPLKSPEHGWIDQTKDYNGSTRNDYGSYARMRCEKGYQLIGTVRRQCQADGTWSGEDAICQRTRANCYRIPEVRGAKIEGKRKLWYAHGSSIFYNCVGNYILTGNRQFSCVDGYWMGGDFNCTRAVCKLSPLDLRYGRFHGVDRMTIVHGESVSIRKTVKCDEGYTVPPNISYISCYNGTLDPPNFDCVKYDDSIRLCHLSKNEGKVIRYRDKCYLATKLTFINRHYHAKPFCQKLGSNAYLAIIPDKETNEAIRYLMNMVPGENKYWFGATWNDNSRWEWPNGKLLNYTNWNYGEGGKTGEFVKLEHCAVLTKDGIWEDTFCRNHGLTEYKYRAMCEIANSCSDHEFQCGSGKCIDVTKYCDGYPDCLDESDEVIGCEAECVLNDLKKFLYKDEPVKAVYRSGDTISISCPMDYDYGIAYGHDYNLEETSTELTCNDGRWVGYIPKCIGNEDSNIKSTPTADLDAVTNSIDVNATHVLAGSTSNARSEFGNSRGDDIKPQTDIGFITTTEKSYADKAACQLNGLSQYLMKNQPAKELYRYGQKIIIACPRDDSDDHEYDYNQLSDDSHSELTCHDGQWIGSYPECFKSCIPDVLKDFLMEDHDATAEYRSGEIISVSCPRNSSESQGAKKIWDYEFDDQARANWTKYLTCLNGRWVGEYPECFERCRRSRIQGTLVVKTESEYFLPGDVVQIQICWGNFPVEGDGQLTCMANGVWYGNATCPPLSDSDCLTPPDVQYAYISGNQWDRYPEGSVITYKCRQAYWLRGNNKLTCINGKWTEEQFYCEIRTCLYPGEIENGQILNMTVEVGQYNHFRCNEGYTLKGPHTMLCYADGTFHSDMMMPTCEAVECQPLKPPEHGWIDQNKDYNNKVRNNFGSYLWVRCMEGYQLIGPVRRHCQANGTWSGEDAICQKRGANCYRIPEVPGAKIYGERRQMYADGSNISYICVEDYILSGNNQFLCVDGQWMGGDFNCTSPVCKLSPLDLRYGRFHGVDRMTIVHGESVSIRKTVNCDEGFTVPPNISYISCYNGTLDPPKFDCVKYDDSISSCHLSKNEGKLIRYRDKCYLATKYTFRFGNPNAKTFCQTLGFKAYLAIIPDKETNEAIRYLMNMVPRKNKYWFGAMWNNDNSRWEWPNGKPLNYTNWKSGEGGKTAYVVKFEHCAILTSDGLWEDKNCRPFVFTGDTYMAICEIPANW